ncbi:MAG: hypothetical protein HYY02_01640 [Chloroflexi bacterium]|nr:hypothetical protein [Chloroflexota bacterium]
MPKYYDAWEPGVFPAQRPLCRALEDTDYALEEPDLNPLTLRLAGAHQAANALDDRIREASRGLARLWQEAQALWSSDAAAVAVTEEVYVSPAGEAQTVATAVLLGQDGPPQRHRTPEDAALVFPVAECQQLLFHFFTSYCAALDRLAREVGRLFALRPEGATWRQLTAVRRGPNRLLRPLREREPALFAWLSGFHKADVDTAFAYLDTFHQVGHFPARATVERESRRWRLWIGAAAGDGPVELSTDAVQLCRVLMRDGLTVVNTTYHILYRHWQQHGPPPW